MDLSNLKVFSGACKLLNIFLANYLQWLKNDDEYDINRIDNKKRFNRRYAYRIPTTDCGVK